MSLSGLAEKVWDLEMFFCFLIDTVIVFEVVAQYLEADIFK